jgi:hypothetical protein
MPTRKLNILQVCDHLGWEGSRMHGVKRLFSWMIPRFDATRFNVSLVSLRKKDLSEETLDALGIDISSGAVRPGAPGDAHRRPSGSTCLHATGDDLGRMVGAMRGIPPSCTSANLTSTPGSREVADRRSSSRMWPWPSRRAPTFVTRA